MPKPPPISSPSLASIASTIPPATRPPSRNDLFRAFLAKARDRHSLSFLQPGRFLCPGNLADAPYLWFRAARCSRQRPHRAVHAGRADGGTLRGLQARGGRAFLSGPFPLAVAPDRAGGCVARAAGRPRGVRGSAARAAGHPEELPLRLGLRLLEAAQGPAYRQGHVRGDQGRPCSGYSARSPRRAVAQHGGRPGHRDRQRQRRFDFTALLR